MYNRHLRSGNRAYRIIAIVLVALMVLNASPVSAGPSPESIRQASLRASERAEKAPVVDVEKTDAPKAAPAPLAPVMHSTPAPSRSTAGMDAAAIPVMPSSAIAAKDNPSVAGTPVVQAAAYEPLFWDVPALIVPPGAEMLLSTQDYRRHFLPRALSATEIPLATGWNLASLPETPADTDPAVIFAAIADKISQVYAYDGCDAADPWKLYDPADPLASDLTALDTSMGFWIETTGSAVLDVNGTPPQNVTIPLCVGWNLIGYPFDQSLPVRGALSAIEGKYSHVFAYNPAAPTDPWLGYKLFAPDYANDLAAMQPGRGYWILATEDTTLTIQGPGAPPSVSIDDPLEGAELTTFTGITGTVSGPAVANWVLAHKYADDGVWTEFASGTGEVDASLLGTFDPTLLLNGIYRLRLTATDLYGQTAVDELDVLVDGQLKIGLFTLSFVDLAIPVSGIPIQIVRTYDSRDKRQHDFGVGWTLDIRRGSYTNNRKPGDGWRIESTGGFFPIPCAITNETKYHVTEVRFSDVEYYRFALRLGMSGFSSAVGGGCLGTAYFEQIGGIPGAELSVLGDDTVFWDAGSDQVYGVDGVSVFEPDSVQLQTIDGRRFDLSLADGLTRVQDLNGNALTIDENGVTHSSGKSISFDRDIEGRIVTITDPMGYALDYGYDPYGDLVNHRDRSAQTSRYIYDTAHNLVEIIAPNGISAARTEYDENGRMLSTTDAVGNTVEFSHILSESREIVRDRLGYPTIYSYDDRGNVVAETNALGKTRFYAYDERDNLLSETDELGRTTTYTYNDLDQLSTRTDYLGGTRSYTYNERGQILAMANSLGQTTQYNHNELGNLIGVTDPEGNTTVYAYDSYGNRISKTDAEGNTTRYVYDRSGNRVRMVDPLNHVTTYVFDANGNKLQETKLSPVQGDAFTWVTVRTYDANGNQLSLTDPLGQVTSYEYDALGNRTAVVASNGDRVEFSFNHHRQMDGLVYVDGGTNSFAYDAEGRRTGATNREGETTSYVYDAVGQPIAMLLADGTPGDFSDNSRIAVEYDDAGQLIALNNERNIRTEFEHPVDGRQMVTRDALGNETVTVYDAAGREVAQTDPLGRTTQFRYDSHDRPTETIYADGTSVQMEYDSRGNLIAYIDQADRTTQFEYDARDRLTAVVDAEGRRTEYGYDFLGNLVQQVNALGRVTRYEYDALNRRTAVILPMGQRSSTAYDKLGNLMSHTDFNGNTITYEYDDNNLLTAKRYPDGTSVLVEYTTSGRLSRVEDSLGVTTFTYDVLDRLLSRTNPDGISISYTYDAAGNVTSITSLSGTTYYTYDLLNRMATVTDSEGGVTQYTYDAAGNLIRTELPNGTVEIREYDELNRITFLRNADSTGQVLSSYRYTFDAVGNRIRVEENNGRIVSYSYDDTDWLVEEAIVDDTSGNLVLSYTYDPVGNRLQLSDSNEGQTDYVYDENNRLIRETVADADTTYTYDKNGNMRSFFRDSVNRAEYRWDYEGRLRAADVLDHGTASHIEYQYEHSGIRVAQSVDQREIRYLIDHNRPFATVLEEYDSGGTPEATYSYGLSPLAQYRFSASTYYLFDAHSGVREVVDSAGQSLATYTYDAFGRLLSPHEDTNNSIKYRGEFADFGTRLIYLRARYYWPSRGRFISADSFEGLLDSPISLNSYVYAHNNPVMLADPSGRSPRHLIELGAVLAILGVLSGVTLGAGLIALASLLDARDTIDWKGEIAGGLSGSPIFSPVGGQAGAFAARADEAACRRSGDYLVNAKYAIVVAGLGIGLGPSLIAKSSFEVTGSAPSVSTADNRQRSLGGAFVLLSISSVVDIDLHPKDPFEVLKTFGVAGFIMGTGFGYSMGEARGYDVGIDYVAGFSIPLMTGSDTQCVLDFDGI